MPQRLEALALRPPAYLKNAEKFAADTYLRGQMGIAGSALIQVLQLPNADAQCFLRNSSFVTPTVSAVVRLVHEKYADAGSVAI